MNTSEHWTRRPREERDAEIVRRLLAAGERDKAIAIARARGKLVWVACRDGVDIAYPDAADRDEAATEYVATGDWDRRQTGWVDLVTWPRYVVESVLVDDKDDTEKMMVKIESEEKEEERRNDDPRV